MYYVSYLQQKTSQVAVTFYQKIPFFRSSIDLGSLRTARPSFPHPWWPFFRLSLRTLFAAPRKRGEQTNKPMKLVSSPRKNEIPIDYSSEKLFFSRKKMVGKRWLVGDGKRREGSLASGSSASLQCSRLT